MKNTDDSVEKTIELRAPRARVWRAISNAQDFGTWFGLGEPLELEGDFVPGARIMARWAGRKDLELFFMIDTVEPERALTFRWVPYEIAEGDDPARHPMTRIEMRLADTAVGTRLTITESGFAALPADKQYKREQNGMGWAIQLQSIAQHLLGGVTVKVETRIARPAAAVFDAIVDPQQLARFFVSRSSGRIAPEARLVWEWTDVGAKLDVEIAQYEQDTKIGLAWSATGVPTKVTLLLERDGSGTKLVATEGPFALTADGVARAMQQTQGWTDFGCCLKAYLEHGIDLRHGKPADHVA
jgi:uncharacterized protein YndB with AHSA1/START domain